MKHRLAAAILSATAIALPVSAATAAAPTTTTLVPPGNSAASQYVEVVPTASGGRPTSSVHTPVPTSSGGSGGSTGGSGGSTGGGSGSTGGGSGSTGTSSAGGSIVAPIRASTRRKLDSLGKAGKAAAAVANATAPASSGTPRANLNVAASGSPAGALFKAVTGSSSGGGLGLLLPVILIGSLLGAAGIVVLKRRGASS